MKKITAAFAIAVIIAVMLPVSAGAVDSIVYSDTNRNIGIVYGEFTGYRFSGTDAPEQGKIDDPSQIAAVKFYIKVETPIEEIGDPVVELGYAFGAFENTGGNTVEHNLDDGLIVTVDVDASPAENDFFDAGLITWSDEVTGTFSVEALNADGEILGNPAIPEIPADTGQNAASEETTETTETTETSTALPQTNAQTNNETSPLTTAKPNEPTPSVRWNPAQRGDEPAFTTAAQGNAPTKAATTGGANIITASVMVMLSAWAIVSFKKKK